MTPEEVTFSREFVRRRARRIGDRFTMPGVVCLRGCTLTVIDMRNCDRELVAVVISRG